MRPSRPLAGSAFILDGRDLRLVCDPSCAAAVRNGTVREGDAEGVRRRFYLPTWR
jgi:hypothetical protein